jgi:hypothetical protein
MGFLVAADSERRWRGERKPRSFGMIFGGGGADGQARGT